jgi:VWFA-related protein
MRSLGQPALLASILLGILVAHPGASQEGRDHGFGEVLRVDLVNVEVWVTDGKGHPVYGLTAEDFELEEDGKPVEITYFDEVHVVQSLPNPLDAETVSAPAHAVAASEASEFRDEPGSLVLYFDELHLRPSGRDRLIEKVREFLATARIPPGNVLILRQGNGLAAEALFGSSDEDLERALDRLAKGDSSGTQIEAEKQHAIDELQQLWEWARSSVQGPNANPCDAFLPDAAREIQRFAFQSQDHIATTVETLYSVASMLSGVTGSKTLIYLSDSLEMSPGTELLRFAQDLCPGYQTITSTASLTGDLSASFRALARHASANRVTLYAMQPEGLRYGYLGSVSQRTVDVRGLNGFQTNARQNERTGLGFLADQTGGRAIYNMSDIGGVLDSIADEMTSYYSLAYTPLHGGDGADHKIEVRLKDRKLKARHRLGYRDKDAEHRLRERMLAAQHLGLVDNPLGVRLGAGTLTPSVKKKWRLPLHVIVPSEEITFIPGPSGSHAKIYIEVQAHNHKGALVVDEKSIVELKEPEQPQLSSIALSIELDAAALYTLVVAVRDETSAETSIVSTVVEAPERASSGVDGSGSSR